MGNMGRSCIIPGSKGKFQSHLRPEAQTDPAAEDYIHRLREDLTAATKDVLHNVPEDLSGD